MRCTYGNNSYMKLCTTTTTSVNLAAKLVLVFVSVLMVFSMLFQMTQRVSADKYDDKINALKQDIEKYKLESERLNGQAATLKSAIAQLANQKATIQVQIDINQAKYNKLLENHCYPMG